MTQREELPVLIERVNYLIDRLEKWERGEMPTCIRHDGRLCWTERNIKALWGVLAVAGTAVITTLIRLWIGG